jgi:hypothetical protein
VPFLIASRLEQADLTSEQGRVAALREALIVLGREPDPELRRAWARSEVARPLGLAYDLVVASAARQGIALDVVEGVATTRAPRPSRRDTAPAPDPAVTDAARDALDGIGTAVRLWQFLAISLDAISLASIFFLVVDLILRWGVGLVLGIGG